MTDETTRLLSCPFCGRNPRLIGGHMPRAECGNCDITLNTGAWNRRSGEPSEQQKQEKGQDLQHLRKHKLAGMISENTRLKTQHTALLDAVRELRDEYVADDNLYMAQPLTRILDKHGAGTEAG